jgi:hypothetical protein
MSSLAEAADQEGTEDILFHLAIFLSVVFPLQPYTVSRHAGILELYGRQRICRGGYVRIARATVDDEIACPSCITTLGDNRVGPWS